MSNFPEISFHELEAILFALIMDLDITYNSRTYLGAIFNWSKFELTYLTNKSYYYSLTVVAKCFFTTNS